MSWALRVLALAIVAVGVLFGLDALGALSNETVGGFVGMGLGVLCLVGGLLWAEPKS